MGTWLPCVAAVFFLGLQTRRHQPPQTQHHRRIVVRGVQEFGTTWLVLERRQETASGDHRRPPNTRMDHRKPQRSSKDRAQPQSLLVFWSRPAMNQQLWLTFQEGDY